MEKINKMKTYKLKGIEYYIANVFSKEEVVIIAWLNKIGVTANDIDETNIVVDRDIVATVFRSRDELSNYVERW